MATIPATLGQGGAHLDQGASGEPHLHKILTDVATDLGTLNGSTGLASVTITAAALAAFTDPPSAAEMALLRTLVNQIRTYLLARTAGGTLLTQNP